MNARIAAALLVLLSVLGVASHWLLVRLERVALPWKA